MLNNIDLNKENTPGVEGSTSSPHKQAASSTIHPKLKLILSGVYDPGSYLSVLRGSPHIVEYIWNLVKTGWKRHIKTSGFPIYVNIPSHDDSHWPRPVRGQVVVREDVSFFMDLHEGWKEWPKPSDININMMPFIADSTFEGTKLPAYLKPYEDHINTVIELAFSDGNWEKEKEKFTF